MTTSFHKDQHLVPVYLGLPSEKEVHGPYSFTFTNEAARLAATGFNTTHVGKLAWQLNNNSFWLLLNYSPIVWSRLDFSTAYSLAFEATCPALLTVGTVVCSTGPYQVDAADINIDSKMPGVGVIVSKSTSTDCRVQWGGEAQGIWSGLTIGKYYYLTAAGGISDTIPGPTTNSYIFRVGQAIASDVLLLGLSITGKRTAS
jgi:hypothetical protein